MQLAKRNAYEGQILFSQPDISNQQFLEILQTYQRESKPIQDVYNFYRDLNCTPYSMQYITGTDPFNENPGEDMLFFGPQSDTPTWLSLTD
ncbi:hypothetical protein W97_02731 [Coniosporium apollinis CBS 100218]|uniref:Uncharacterized protein n=1 Tax=Coniosporium apollinis (strain CBS 100218) TaxID=1168221 RepID=R7YNR6_CONA1|nr:uncharacterized protein W97_02731 [Coniosporium apollinis CBS 100218]EON63503.1 hypothetical protein W97_02731 [Coniosporium apollinis CBS 100218]